MTALHYVSAWIVRGATGLDTNGEFELISSANPDVRVVLTSGLEAWSGHIDRYSVIRKVIFLGGLADTPEKAEIRRQTIEAIRSQRREAFPGGLFLVLSAVKAPIDLPDYHRIDEFGVVMDAVDNDRVREEVRPYLASAIAATLSALPHEADRRVERIGGAAYLVDPDDGRPVYNLNIRTGSPTFSINRPLATDRIPSISRHAVFLANHDNLRKVTRLLLAATTEAEAYGRFMLSWGALEMFIHSTFRERYEVIAKSARADASSALAQAMQPHLREAHDAFPVRARFVAIAGTLAPADLARDSLEFGQLKEERDGFIHTGKQPDLDTHARRSRALLMKFLGLELAARA